MPYQGKGGRHAAIATKAVVHGDPVIEDGFPGSAAKTLQLTRYVDPTSAAATLIAIGEGFEIELGDVVEARAAKLTGGIGGFTVGTPVYIITATNMLTTTSNSGANPKFGRVTQVLTSRGIVRINADARDTF